MRQSPTIPIPVWFSRDPLVPWDGNPNHTSNLILYIVLMTVFCVRTVLFCAQYNLPAVIALQTTATNRNNFGLDILTRQLNTTTFQVASWGHPLAWHVFSSTQVHRLSKILSADGRVASIGDSAALVQTHTVRKSHRIPHQRGAD